MMRVPGERPNVLLVFSDQHRAFDLGCYGNGRVRSPHLDALARDGVRFSQALSNCPLCVPARGTLLTGLFPMRHGALGNDLPLRPGCETLAQAFIRERAGTPWFLTLSWGPPHDPYLPAPEPWADFYRNGDLPVRPNVPETVRLPKGGILDPAGLRDRLAGYYAHISALDACFGRLIRTLVDPVHPAAGEVCNRLHRTLAGQVRRHDAFADPDTLIRQAGVVEEWNASQTSFGLPTLS